MNARTMIRIAPTPIAAYIRPSVDEPSSEVTELSVEEESEEFVVDEEFESSLVEESAVELSVLVAVEAFGLTSFEIELKVI